MDNSVQIISNLVEELREKVKRIEDMENEIKLLKASKKELEEVTIPDTMSELGATQITLLTNEVVVVKPFFYARLPEKPEQFFTWLRGNGFGGLIKEQIKAYPGSETIEALVGFIIQNHIEFESGSTVHWKTLEAWFKEITEAGLQMPDDLFPHYVGRKAQVKG